MAAAGTGGRRSLLPGALRFSAAAAPVLLLSYGIVRLVDGMDGTHGPGLAWNVGHVLFLVGIALFGLVIAGARHLLGPAGRRRVIANGAAVAGGVGVVCFLWVILGDLFPAIDERAPLPDPLFVVGPLLFQLGTVTLLVLLATARPPRVPVWSPLLVVLGFVPIAVDLDLLPIGALLVLAGLAPLVRRPAGDPALP